MTAEQMILAYWGYGTDYNPNNLSEEERNGLKSTVLLMTEWENLKTKELKSELHDHEVKLKKLASTQQGVTGEQIIENMTPQEREIYLIRCAWDKTTQERDDLKNQVKALSAIKKGLETSLTECLASLPNKPLSETEVSEEDRIKQMAEEEFGKQEKKGFCSNHEIAIGMFIAGYKSKH